MDQTETSAAWDYTSGRAADTGNADICMALYLRDIGRVQLLSREQETELANRIKKGDGKARDQMINSNLPLVIKIARAYEGIGLPLLDLISEGNIGLMRAVDRFDPDKGAKLSTYSALWIRQAITKALASQSKAIRLPTHVVDKLRKMRWLASRLGQELGREPTDNELAAELGSTPLRVSQMRMAAIRPASLDEQVDADGSSIAESLADERAVSPCEAAEGHARSSMAREALQTLDERDREILRLRFGLDNESPKTLDEIGKKVGVSSERVRQLQNAAMQKIRCRINLLEQRAPSPPRPRSKTPCKKHL